MSTATPGQTPGTRLGLRTLPVSVTPVPGEALESWLAALAQCLDVEWGTFLGLLFPAARASGKHWLRRLDITAHLTTAELQGISAATGADPATIEAMTWCRFDGLVGTVDVARRRMKMTWPLGRSRFCPACLADSHGRWQLEWRLPWVFACQKHSRLLADSCPACGRTQPTSRGWLKGDLVPAPESCHAAQSDGTRCQRLLSAASTISLPKGHPFLQAQAALSEVLSNTTVTAGLYKTMPASTTQFLADLRLLAMRFAEETALYEHEILALPHPDGDLIGAWDSVEVRRWRAAPATCRTVPALMAAAGISAAVTLLQRDTVDEAAADLQPLLAARRQAGKTVTNAVLSTGNRSPVIAATTVRALRNSISLLDQLRYRAWEPCPRCPHKVPASALRNVPASLWSDWWIRLLPPDGRSGRRNGSRTALAVLLLAVGNRASEPEIARSLGLQPSAGNYAENESGAVRMRLHNDGWWPNVATALTRLADYLLDHPSPIDYARRRRLDYRNILPDNDWQEIFATTDFGRLDCAHTGQRVRNWMFDRVSMLPANRSPFAAPTSAPRGRLEPIELLAPPIGDRLDALATRFLRQHRIFDEPVVWSPPLTLVADLDLPGPDVEALNIEQLHHVIRAQPQSTHAIAQAMGVRPLVVRRLLERAPLQQPLCRGQQRPKKPTRLDRARTQLSRAELARLHEQENWSMHAIGKQFGIDSDVVKQLALEQHISIHLHSRRPKPVEPEWLYHEYIVKQRTVRDIAREVGCNPRTLLAKASQAGIRKHRQTPPISEAWIYTEHVINKRSLADMAREAGVDREVLSRRWRKLGIPVRQNRSSPSSANGSRRST